MSALRLSFLLAALLAPTLTAQTGRLAVYSTFDIRFTGPEIGPKDTPARDVDLQIVIRHESGSPEYRIHGFWDGDGKGGMTGNVFKVRFTPTRPGRWRIVEVRSNRTELNGQKQGDVLTAVAAKFHGFWLVDPDSPGRRWYRRSDGSHQYIVGNTQYSFLSGMRSDGSPAGAGIAADVENNALYFRKLRFSVHSDRYPHPDEKPFLDDTGAPTDSGDFSHRPNARWFHQRTDLAVQAAFNKDLIADLILCGPDEPSSRVTLRPSGNNGDPAPYLRYIAARYGSYPNVWICLCNEYDIKTPRYTQEEIAGYGKTLRGYLPYEVPVSVHPGSRLLWAQSFENTGPWHDHHIVQRKIRVLGEAADVLNSVWRGQGSTPRNKPTVNDELSYQGEGDKHSEQDSLESHLGTFLGGGYGTAGFKPANKQGHYFWGAFDPTEHTAAPGLRFLRESIDRHVRFWKLAPGKAIFSNMDEGFRAMESPGEEYVLGTNRAHRGIVASLPPGEWTVRAFDIVARRETTLSAKASGRYVFDAPGSRAVLFHFRRNR